MRLCNNPPPDEGTGCDGESGSEQSLITLEERFCDPAYDSCERLTSGTVSVVGLPLLV